MTLISIQLPDDICLFAENYARQKGFDSVNEFLSSLLVEVRDRQLKVEAELLVGLDSGSAEPKSDEQWRSLRSQVASKGER